MDGKKGATLSKVSNLLRLVDEQLAAPIDGVPEPIRVKLLGLYRVE